MSEKNFDKYLYFCSKAKNYAMVIRPDKKKIIDGEVVFDEGIRVSFTNKMLRIENSKVNSNIIEAIRKKVKEDESLPENKRSIIEQKRPKEMISKEDVKDQLSAKDLEIKELKEKLNKKSEVKVDEKKQQPKIVTKK